MGKNIILGGWIQTIRDHGDLLFFELRDYDDSLIQCCIDQKTNPELLKLTQDLTNESVISVTGIMRARPMGAEKKDRQHGNIEILISHIEIHSLRTEATHSMPFQINSLQNESVNEGLRQKYRFLDLRNTDKQYMLKARHRLMKMIRQACDEQGFTEVHTPILGPYAPEGARSYIVPSYNQPGFCYALAQAPQLWKQMLMASGLQRYYQIAPCFRAESSRADRSPGEFYQLDMEMAFATQDEILTAAENIVGSIIKNWDPINRPLTESWPGQRIAYKDSMRRFGCDKPDLRNPLEIVDSTQLIADNGPDVLKGLMLEKGYQSWAVWAPNITDKPRSFFTEITDWIKREHQIDGLAYTYCDAAGVWKGPVGKCFQNNPEPLLESRPEFLKNNESAGVFFVCAPKKQALKVTSALRTHLGEKLNLIDYKALALCWVVDFPMYEETDEGTIDFSHNPFSMPQGNIEEFESRDPLDIIAYQYDLVCNGIELCSGAVRNHKPDLMYKIFAKVGYSKEKVDESFGSMIQAFSYGTPPHGGLAPGFDRLLMILLEKTTIRDCIAFPLSQDGTDSMMKSPILMQNKDLREMGLQILPHILQKQQGN